MISFKRDPRFTYTEERIYKTLWHIGLCGVGLYELKTHKTKIGKFLAIGLILFHLDAVVTDAACLEKTVSRQLLEKLLGKES